MLSQEGVVRLRQEIKSCNLSQLTETQTTKLGLGILQIKPKERRKDDMTILKTMTKTNGFFKKQLEQYGEQTLTELLKHCYLEYVPEGEVLFELESPGFEFFIILEGQVSIHINLKDPDYVERKQTVLLSPNIPFKNLSMKRWKSQFPGVPKSPPNRLSKVLRKHDGYHILHKEVLLKNINHLKKGSFFGDQSIIGKNTLPRNATIFCDVDCFFAVLDKKNFNRVIGEQQEKETLAKVNFLSQITLFSRLSVEQIKTLIHFLKLETFKFRDTILAEGQKVDNIYIINKGTVKLTKNVYQEEDEEEIKERNPKFVRSKKAGNSKNLELTTKTEMQTFAEEFIFQNRVAGYSVIANSGTVEVFSMEKDKYLPRLHINLNQKVEFIRVCKESILRGKIQLEACSKMMAHQIKQRDDTQKKYKSILRTRKIKKKNKLYKQKQKQQYEDELNSFKSPTKDKQRNRSKNSISFEQEEDDDELKKIVNQSLKFRNSHANSFKQIDSENGGKGYRLRDAIRQFENQKMQMAAILRQVAYPKRKRYQQLQDQRKEFQSKSVRLGSETAKRPRMRHQYTENNRTFVSSDLDIEAAHKTLRPKSLLKSSIYPSKNKSDQIASKKFRLRLSNTRGRTFMNNTSKDQDKISQHGTSFQSQLFIQSISPLKSKNRNTHTLFNSGEKKWDQIEGSSGSNQENRYKLGSASVDGGSYLLCSSPKRSRRRKEVINIHMNKRRRQKEHQSPIRRGRFSSDMCKTTLQKYYSGTGVGNKSIYQGGSFAGSLTNSAELEPTFSLQEVRAGCDYNNKYSNSRNSMEREEGEDGDSEQYPILSNFHLRSLCSAKKPNKMVKKLKNQLQKMTHFQTYSHLKERSSSLYNNTRLFEGRESDDQPSQKSNSYQQIKAGQLAGKYQSQFSQEEHQFFLKVNAPDSEVASQFQHEIEQTPGLLGSHLASQTTTTYSRVFVTFDQGLQ